MNIVQPQSKISTVYHVNRCINVDLFTLTFRIMSTVAILSTCCMIEQISPTSSMSGLRPEIISSLTSYFDQLFMCIYDLHKTCQIVTLHVALFIK
jgi:hypothetical protein